MRILFTSAHTLLDHGNGAARSVGTLLWALRRRGHAVLALTGSLQDGAGDPGALQPVAPGAGPELGGCGADAPVASAFVEPAVLTGDVAGVRHAVLRFRASRSDRMLASEEDALFAAWDSGMRRFAPDVVLTFGGLVFNRLVMAEAARRGAGTVFYLGGPGYGGKEAFEAVDAVLAVSQALASECGLAGDPRVHPILPAVDLDAYLVERPSPEYVLFVNPQAAKGCAVFSAVAERAEALGLPHRFLVVESRGTWAAALQQFPALGARRNVTVLPRQADMRAVYRRTHTLMFPSLWFEAAGRVLREAAVSGIPVVAHRVGGVAETLPGGAELLDPPAELLRDWAAPVPEAFVSTWLAALDRLRADPAHYAERSARARQAAGRVELASQADRVERILEEARSKGRARRGAR